MIWSAFLIGLLGSFHCVGMCGPLALAVPSRGLNRVLAALTYNLGRVLTYSVLGFLTGLVGKGFSLAGFQQGLSIIAGVAILLIILLPENQANRFLAGRWLYAPIATLKQKLGILFTQSTYASVFSIGILNGLLPCGLVYVALFAALALGNPLLSFSYMALFGIGTFPLMLTLIVSGNLISQGLRTKIRKIVPVTVAIVGLLLIARGMNLGIPYVSPKIQKAGIVSCH